MGRGSRLPLVALALLAAAACTHRAEEVLPLAPDIVGNARVADIAIVVRPEAAAAVAALDEAAAEREGEDPRRRLPFAALLERSLDEAAREAGLVSGRPLRIVAEIDILAVPGTGRALVGSPDRLAGTVFVHDLASAEQVGQLYVDVDRRHPGLIGLATRGTGVRERLVDEFARRVAAALAGRATE